MDLAKWPPAALPKRLRPCPLTFDAEEQPTGRYADRCEFCLYRQVRKRFQRQKSYDCRVRWKAC
jgi:hypothetical protein